MLLNGCESPEPPAERSLVLEAWINSEGTPVAILTESYRPEAPGAVKDLLVRWGKVTISDGTDTVVMTGGMDDNYFPPYRYFTSRMWGKPGKEYTVTASYDGLEVTATARMLFPTPIDRIETSRIPGEDSVRSVRLDFTAPVDCPAYYYVTVRKMEERLTSQPQIAVLSPTVAESPGEQLSITVYNPKDILQDERYESNPKIGERWEINLCRVEKEIYDFWYAFDNFTLFGNTQFISGQGNITGNVKGGYGIFSAQAVSTQYLLIE